MSSHNLASFGFVTCASSLATLGQRLLASPCLAAGGYPLAIYFNASSAAEGFNSAMRVANDVEWLIWVHQDVFLPDGWDVGFARGLIDAQTRYPDMAVAGVYGVAGAATLAKRAGQVLDRGNLLREPEPLPCLVDSLDELLFAVRVDSGLRLDPALGFDFYATDLVLQAQANGRQAVVIDAYCEHWSDTPASGCVPGTVVDRICASAAVFERKWATSFPVTTPCFDIARKGDVAEFIRRITTATP